MVGPRCRRLAAGSGGENALDVADRGRVGVDLVVGGDLGDPSREVDVLLGPPFDDVFAAAKKSIAKKTPPLGRAPPRPEQSVIRAVLGWGLATRCRRCR